MQMRRVVIGGLPCFDFTDAVQRIGQTQLVSAQSQ
jgi:hypothetical protein